MKMRKMEIPLATPIADQRDWLKSGAYTACCLEMQGLGNGEVVR